MGNRKLIAGNWKMNPTSRDAALALAVGVRDGAKGNDRVDVAVAPPAIYLLPIGEALKGSHVRLGAQNLCWEDEGAFTGEISAPMLAEAGGSFAIIGHSERREHFAESGNMINRRLKHALASGLTAILCIGEHLRHRDAGMTKAVVEEQLRAALVGFAPADLKNLIVAYEPVWAIGTGRNAEPGQIGEAHAQIREYLRNGFGEEVGAGRILYGGSVKPENAAEIFATEGVDGALVGGASLEAESFTKLVELAT